MWEWILKELNKAVKFLPINRKNSAIDVAVSRDDIVQNVILQLVENKPLAEKIFNNREIGMLYLLAKKELYNISSRTFFNNKEELSRYQRIINVCTKYAIEPIPKNAYKISGLLENGTSNFPISVVVEILKKCNPSNSGHSARTESLEAYLHKRRKEL